MNEPRIIPPDKARALIMRFAMVGRSVTPQEATDLAHTAAVLGDALERVEEALARHPEPCTDTPYTCGWKRAVVDIRAALASGVTE